VDSCATCAVALGFVLIEIRSKGNIRIADTINVGLPSVRFLPDETEKSPGQPPVNDEASLHHCIL
jgi:hypothetical protein